MPNGTADEDHSNDTLSVERGAKFDGTYTIGGASPDFTNFTEAVADLTSFEVAGQTTFNIRNGTYNEQVTIGEINGMDATNTVTFQSELGDSSQVILSFGALTLPIVLL